ncbi:prepilin-type N-terminal cleavage/methylation domain-containing protein [Deferribacteraceae bacterium V6Fe1]|nr:prepilin-type N-terminal cleavage/methylation domain-containing protein [Deferribacteraceae bacterium V6Fe1]
MDRKIMNKKGITLIELMVTITVMAVLIAIAIPSFNKWLSKYQIEADTKDIYALIQDARAKAFSQKEDITIVVNANTTTVKKSDGSVISSISTKTSFKSNTINITKRGIISGGSSILPTTVSGLNPQYNCIAISDLRARLGYSSDGSNCNAK